MGENAKHHGQGFPHLKAPFNQPNFSAWPAIGCCVQEGVVISKASWCPPPGTELFLGRVKQTHIWAVC